MSAVSARANQWIVSGDVGSSSKAIWSHMMNGSARRDARDRFAVFGVDHPHDSGDFGRCFRLLSLIPEWSWRLHEMAQYSAEWRALVARWDELSAMYAAVQPRNWSDWKAWKPMCDTMHDLLTAARVCADCGKVGMSAWSTYPGDVKLCSGCARSREASEAASTSVAL